MIAIVTSCLYYVCVPWMWTLYEYLSENFPKNLSSNILQCCTIALKKFQKYKVQCEILA
jgi:hypothetical protein